MHAPREDEDRDHHVVGRLRPVPIVDVALIDPHGDAALCRQRACFGDAIGREIEGVNVETLLRQPDTVAAFAVGDGERLQSRFEQVLLVFQESVRRLAEVIVGR
jgi:hypothetical protein